MSDDRNWECLADFFNSLNSHCKYLVLRNYENMTQPDFFCDGHEDIDILCDDYDIFCKAAKAIPLYNQDSIHLSVIIEHRTIPIDLRTVGDYYYDTNWEQDMLLRRRLEHTEQGDWYVMEEEDYYRSLVYHAYLQKKQISEDYPERLNKMAYANGIKEETKEECLWGLNSFMKEHGYVYTYPSDISVPLNVELIPSDMVNGENRAFKEGRKIEHPNSAYIKLYNMIYRSFSLLQSYILEHKASLLGATIVYIILHAGKIIDVSERMMGEWFAGLGLVFSLAFIGWITVFLIDIFKVSGTCMDVLSGAVIVACPYVAVVLMREHVFGGIITSALAVTGIRLLFSNRKGMLLLGIALSCISICFNPSIIAPFLIVLLVGLLVRIFHFNIQALVHVVLLGECALLVMFVFMTGGLYGWFPK